MINSIALWVNDPPVESDLHINYWIIKRGVLFRDHFIDFGIKLLDWGGGKINMYFPIKNIEKDIYEITSELCQRELANALFNENCEITSNSGKRFEIGLPEERLTAFIIDKETVYST
jgi:hypothetical protein